MLTLKPYQELGARHLLSNPRAALWDTMGLGKTAQALSAVRRTPWTDILVIAPLATELGWRREVQMWLPDAQWVRIERKSAWPRERTPANSRTVYFVPWTDLACRTPSELKQHGIQFDVLIADEAHKIKGGTKTKMGKAFVGEWYKRQNDWCRVPGYVDLANRVWLLTGTPMPNGRPIELLPALQVLGVVGSRTGMRKNDYLERFCKQANRFHPQGFDYNGARNLDELARLILASGVALRRTPSDVPGELPELQRVHVPLAAGKDRLSEQRAQAVLAYMAAHDGLPPFEELAAYRHDVGLRKVPAAAAWLSDTFETEPAVVFCHHHDVAEQVAQRLREHGHTVIVAHGGMSAEERQAAVDQFAAADGPQFLIATIDACGTGMNGMHRRTSTAVFVESSWTPASLDQAEGRVRRLGGVQTDRVLAYYLVAHNCLDAHITELINRKRQQILVTVRDG